MSINVIGLINGNINLMDIYNVICKEYDSNAIYDIDNDEKGYIIFNDENNKRKLWISKDNNSSGIYTKFFDMGIKKEYVYISLQLWGNAEKIINTIINYFGGFIKSEFDRDYISIEKNKNFDFSSFIKNRNNIIDILDNSLSQNEKILIANQILLNKDKLKDILF